MEYFAATRGGYRQFRNFIFFPAALAKVAHTSTIVRALGVIHRAATAANTLTGVRYTGDPPPSLTTRTIAEVLEMGGETNSISWARTPSSRRPWWRRRWRVSNRVRANALGLPPNEEDSGKGAVSLLT